MLGKSLQQKISIKIEFTYLQVVAWALVLLTGAYVAWEIYWYNKAGLHFIKWHTHLVFTALFFGTLVYLPLALIASFSRRLPANSIKTITLSVVLTFTLIELIAMATGWGKTYSEKVNGYYISPYQKNKRTYHTYPPNSSSSVNTPEFSYSANYNSLGYTDSEWPKERDSSKIRIITLGDSFTEGYGAPSDSSYPALLSTILGTHYEILNAGVCGSDPVFGLKNLQDRLLVYKPDWVMQTVTENDVVFDMCVGGGFERFGADMVLQQAQSPAWEPLYALSYSARIFLRALGYSMQTPCGPADSKAFIARQNLLLQDIFDRYERLGAKNDIQVLIVFFPTRSEVLNDNYDFDFTESKKYIHRLNHVKYVDLFQCYRSKIKRGGMAADSYYWKIDGHHNSLGYRLMAECIASAVKPLAETDTCKKLP